MTRKLKHVAIRNWLDPETRRNEAWRFLRRSESPPHQLGDLGSAVSSSSENLNFAAFRDLSNHVRTVSYLGIWGQQVNLGHASPLLQSRTAPEYSYSALITFNGSRDNEGVQKVKRTHMMWPSPFALSTDSSRLLKWFAPFLMRDLVNWYFLYLI